MKIHCSPPPFLSSQEAHKNRLFVESRNAIRRQMRQRRRTLSPQRRLQAAQRVCKTLCSSLLFLRSQRIGCYLANEGEIDLAPAIAKMELMGKNCYLPTIRPLGQNRLDFVPYRTGDVLIENCYGIPEPRSMSRPLPPWALDLLLLPLVAFDSRGNRLGMGGGYYDRTLAYLRLREHWRTPLLLGVAYQFQKVESITAKAWDIPLDGVVTDAELLLFDR